MTTTAPLAWLRCHDCDVRWTTATAEPCWVCGSAGQRAGQPYLQPCAPIRLEVTR